MQEIDAQSEAGEEIREKVARARAVGASEKILYKTDMINYVR